MSISAHIRPSEVAGVRLTRRGRVAVICAVMLVLLAVLWLGVRHGARATSGSGRPAAGMPEAVVVRPHDTLWGIAVRNRPGVDPHDSAHDRSQRPLRWHRPSRSEAFPAVQMSCAARSAGVPTRRRRPATAT